MRLVMIGTGYVGLVSGACFAELGHEVVCVDKDEQKIAALQSGQVPIYEPGLEALVQKNTGAKRLSFSSDIKIVKDADAVFIAVGTPSKKDEDEADLSYVFAAAEEVAKYLQGYTVVVTKSTVSVGVTRRVEEIIRAARANIEVDVVNNPEFLRQGAAIDDFMRPDRIVIGCESPEAEAVMREIYRPLHLIETPIIFTTRETSEMIKYAGNAFLAAKITFINQIADLCEQVGADVQDVARGIGLDSRIGRKFLQAGPGYGGSCFPKDTKALAKTARDNKAPLTMVESVIAANQSRKENLAQKIIEAVGKGKKVAVLGLTFKPDTDDLRESPALTILPMLNAAGISIAAYDPQGMKIAKAQMPFLQLGDDPYSTMKGADALVILTEWNEFKALDWDRVRENLKSPLVIDLRNIYEPDEVAGQGFTYISVGRPIARPLKAAVKLVKG